MVDKASSRVVALSPRVRLPVGTQAMQLESVSSGPVPAPIPRDGALECVGNHFKLSGVSWCIFKLQPHTLPGPRKMIGFGGPTPCHPSQGSSKTVVFCFHGFRTVWAQTHVAQSLGAIDVTKPYKLIWFGAIDITKPCKLMAWTRRWPNTLRFH